MGDNDFPALMPNWGKAKDKATLWSKSGFGSQDYFQTGTDIPTLAEGSGGAYAAGTGMEPAGFAYDYAAPQQVAGSPSFDLAPDIDSPAVDRWIQDVRSAPGYKPPTFLSPQEMRRRVLELDRRMRMRV
jgi:hypothetical protein